MFVSVGSRSNAGERKIYAPWQSDEGRALVLAFTPEGKDRRLYATGLRNCVGMAVQPRTGGLWFSVNERDGLGDDLVPDFVTRVREGGFTVGRGSISAAMRIPVVRANKLRCAAG